MVAEPLIVIVGPTASGKTALAIELASKFDGEIICADSRTVYRGLDIGTAKPTIDEQSQAHHHLLDVVDLDKPFTVADFKTLANKAIDSITSRGKLPIMVGGSGLYVDSVLFDYSFSPKGSMRDTENPRHVSSLVSHSKNGMRDDTLVIGLDISREELKKRIENRIELMVNSGLLNEVKWLLSEYPKSKALDSTGYKALRLYIENEITLEEAKQQFIKNDLNLAKRQMTWFRRNKAINWISAESAQKIVDNFINS